MGFNRSLVVGSTFNRCSSARMMGIPASCSMAIVSGGGGEMITAAEKTCNCA